MKTDIKKLFGVIVIGLVACGDVSTAPGKGAAFPASMTAKDLWNLVSIDFYIPDGIGKTKTTADCDLGGKATVTETAIDMNSGRQDFQYADCKASFLQNEEYKLTQNGTANFLATLAPDSHITYELKQHVSFSGDIGFSADCDFTIELSDKIVTSGECHYEDSEGKVLSIDGDALTQAVEEIFEP